MANSPSDGVPVVPARQLNLEELNSLTELLANQVVILSGMMIRVLKGGKWSKGPAVADLEIIVQELRNSLPNHYASHPNQEGS